MRIDLLEQWLKMFPYGYCDGMNFQTCRANENNCPYCMSNVHCSDGNAAIEYYREMLRFKKMKPRKARKVAIEFAKALPSIMRALNINIAQAKADGRLVVLPCKAMEKGREKMFSISKQDALKIVQAMRMLKLLDEQFFNDVNGAERLMNDLTLFVIGEEDGK